MTSASISEKRIERVARAICVSEKMNPDDVLGGWVHWKDAALAAIEADAPEIAAAETRGKIAGLFLAQKETAAAIQGEYSRGNLFGLQTATAISNAITARIAAHIATLTNETGT